MELLKNDDPEQQMVYHQPGVGTYGLSPPGYIASLFQKSTSLIDQAVAWYLYQHVIDGYTYLMETYRAGDQISIFGFSRGAYTARALAGMLHSVGLLTRHNIEQVSFAYQIYAASAEILSKEDSGSFTASAGGIDPKDFMRAFCILVSVTFLGVWQALALDENRGNFIPSVWDHSSNIKGLQTSVEVWFKGGHSDIGGGEPPQKPSENSSHTNGDASCVRRPPQLSYISLRWMIRRCLDTQEARILFNPVAMCSYRDRMIIEPRAGTGNETQEGLNAKLDKHDIQATIHRASDDSWFWWAIDFAPVPKLSQTEKCKPERGLVPGMLWNVLQYLPESIRPETKNGSSWLSRFVKTPTLSEGSTSRPKTVWASNHAAPRIINFQGAHRGVYLHASIYSYIENQLREKAKIVYEPSAKWYDLPALTKGAGKTEKAWPEFADGEIDRGALQDKDVEQMRKHFFKKWDDKELW
ncbi:unnamed protein product [Rhizoctonia solani]|uniref:T6SS Phospholipase effector Tle1-like catalytic domain-containing protein n=1 Tax=Rhizoctonia solani TaxID=456999 RepID=A0A8H2WFV8_9AGAM|nr:unnamed protein product [Rhizoctonia solani]